MTRDGAADRIDADAWGDAQSRATAILLGLDGADIRVAACVRWNTGAASGVSLTHTAPPRPSRGPPQSWIYPLVEMTPAF
jgi:hypothetical protein